jgi:hypothetical protein
MVEIVGEPAARKVADWLAYDARAERTKDVQPEPAAPVALGEWDAGDDTALPPPRGWLLGNGFARTFLSSLLGVGGTGKSSLRYAQYLSLATGRQLTGEHVFQRCRVLIVSLEDDANELRRRILAARLHHNISIDDVRGWLFLSAPGARTGKLMVLDPKGRCAVPGTLAKSPSTSRTMSARGRPTLAMPTAGAAPARPRTRQGWSIPSPRCRPRKRRHLALPRSGAAYTSGWTAPR